MSRFTFPAIAAGVFFLALALPVLAEETAWSPLLTVRFGNIDAIDAEDGELARFVRNVRNDGRFLPPMRTLIGPEIRNPTFFGVTFEGWVEGVVLASSLPGATRLVWAFPVDNRDEYLTLMTNQGLTEYEGMDGVSILREMGADGNILTWYMQWLPGNVAVFGADREAVMAARRVYADRSAARGLLSGAGGRYVNPDVTVRLDMPALAAWQDREAGSYWWRERIDKLTRDLVGYWKPGNARERVIWSMADALTMWPRETRRFDASFWFEPEGVEWRLEVDRDYALSRKSDLGLLRSLPDRTAVASASPVNPASFSRQMDWLGELLLSSAGGVVTREARDTARAFGSLLADGGVREAVAALIPPPTGYPELGGARLLVTEWQNPSQADRAWSRAAELLGSDETVANAFSQMGLRVKVETDELDPGTLGITISPADEAATDAYYHGTWSYRREGSVAALVTGVDRDDAADRDKVREYRGNLAANTVSYGGEGGPDIRTVFTRVGPDGASWAGLFEPVRFLQFCLIEAADWRPRSPDQHEPLSTQLAREMLEYSSGRAWTAVGDSRLNHWRFDGGLTWDSLTRLAAALGISESIGM